MICTSVAGMKSRRKMQFLFLKMREQPMSGYRLVIQFNLMIASVAYSRS